MGCGLDLGRIMSPRKIHKDNFFFEFVMNVDTCKSIICHIMTTGVDADQQLLTASPCCLLPHYFYVPNLKINLSLCRILVATLISSSIEKNKDMLDPPLPIPWSHLPSMTLWLSLMSYSHCIRIPVLIRKLHLLIPVETDTKDVAVPQTIRSLEHCSWTNYCLPLGRSANHVISINSLG